VEVSQDQEQFLTGEALRVAVRVTNRSGQTLHLGAEDDWLTFSIEGHDGMILPRLSDVPVKDAFTLESSKKATKRLDLAPYFLLSKPGRYAIIATVKIKEWDQEIVSRPKYFDLIEGTRLWEQEFGVPEANGATNAAPEVRKYVLQEASYLQGQLRLYLRVADATGAKVFRLTPLGRLLSFSQPEAHVDSQSDLHVMYQDGPHSFSYFKFNPDGQLLIHQTYDYAESRPRLKASDEGIISPVGGVRRETDTDYPVKKSEPSSTNSSQPAVPSTAPNTQ
jgi:hypothetical protein